MSININQEYIDKTTSMLEGYQEKQRKIAALRYDLAHSTNHVTEEEIISQMALPGHSEESGVRSVSHISDQTMYIALNYSNQAFRLNTEESDRILDLLKPMEEELERLEFYVALLPNRLRSVLELHYFKGLPWAEVAKSEAVSARTIADRRSAAIDRLADLLFLKESGRK